MSIKKARKTLQNKEKFNYDILDKVANSGRNAEVEMQGQKNELKSPPSYGMTRVCHLRMQNGAFCGSIFSASVRFVQCLCGL